MRIIASPTDGGTEGGDADGGSGERVSAGVRGDSRFLCEMRGRDDGRVRGRAEDDHDSERERLRRIRPYG